MANVFLNLPAVINATGAPVDTSALGRIKTFVIEGAFTGTLTLEASVDGGATFFPVRVFSSPGIYELEVAAQFMRVRSRGAVVLAPFSVQIDLGATDIGGSYGVIPAPALNAVGAQLNVSAFGSFTTIVVTGAFSGVIAIEATEDGSEWFEVATFQANGLKSLNLLASGVRARSRGGNTVAPFSPVIAIGSINDAGAGGGSGGGGSNCLIFRPGSAETGPVVFNDWGDLMTQLADLRSNANSDGCYTIVFDDSVTSPAVIPAGGPYDMTGVTWEGRTPSPTGLGTQAVVQISDGAEFTRLRHWRHNLRVQFSGATVPISDGVGGDVFTMRDNVTFLVTGGSAAFIDFSGSLPVDETADVIADEVVLIGDGSNTVIRGFYSIAPDEGSGTVRLLLGSEVLIQQDALVFGNGLHGDIFYRNGSARILPQTTLTGDVTTTTHERWQPNGPITGGTVVTATDEDVGTLYRCNPDTNDITINLPPVTELNEGQPFAVKRIDTAAANDVRVVPDGTDEIDSGGAGTAFVISTPLKSNTFISDGVGGWDVI